MLGGVWSLGFRGKLPGVASFLNPALFPNPSFLGHSRSQHGDLWALEVSQKGKK